MPDTACPDAARHTVHPTGYISHSLWAEQMLLTHTQRSCPGCGWPEIWEPNTGDLAAPALVDDACSGCGTYYPPGTPIRTDGAGGWMAACCPAEVEAVAPVARALRGVHAGQDAARIARTAYPKET
ncbi:hypothetical protein [Streptosporangium sp. NPDC002721]|uniref:hypothetical protein n=1 Tax=Streptosporangium sp. NPDC002721 TaxID=3366188 RepID=UPI0036CDD4A8